MKQRGQLLGVADELSSTRDELLAIRCQSNRARRALQETAADVGLESSNRHRHARLRETEMFGSPGEAGQLRNLHEHPQRIYFHALLFTKY